MIRFFKLFPTALLLIAVFCLESCQSNSRSPLTGIRQDSLLFSGPLKPGIVELDIIDEASGLAASRSNKDFLWTHNDSGGEAALYLMSTSGESKGTFTLPDIDNVDWEDLAIGPGPVSGVNYLFVGDIGDNFARRSSVIIYRTLEPDLSEGGGSVNGIFTSFDKIEYQYPDGSRDAETLMIDPLTKDIIIVSKREKAVNVYRLPFPQSTTEINTAEFLTSIPITSFVGGDISADGLEILMKTYEGVYYWKRSKNELIQETFQKEFSTLNYTPEPQGEAIAWSLDGSRYYTVSEERDGIPAVIYSYNRN